MDRKRFFDSLRARASGVFGTSLSQSQVQGVEAILDSAARNRVTEVRHVANILAQVYHETGGRMVPVRETFAASDAQAIARLDAAWAKGQLTWVKTPYWRSGWFGRGHIQITHEENYRKMGQALGVNLAGNPSLALDMKISADIAVVGMRDGMFRAGNNLAKYFNATTDDPRNARRIVNGPDGTEAQIAKYHAAFLAALKAGDYSAPSAPVTPSPAPKPQPAPQPAPAPAPDGETSLAVPAILFAAAVGVAALLFFLN